MEFTSILYAGHSAVFLKRIDFTLAIDPWLEGNPLCPEELKNEKIDLIVLTHGHSDHASDVVRLYKANKCKIVATFELCNLLSEEGIESSDLIFMNKGGTIDLAGITISLTHARHSNSCEACGVVIKDDSRSYYHAGDTDLFSDMKLIAKKWNPEYAFLPIGDIFTMGPEDAVTALEFIKPEKLIPIHYKTFDLLTGTVSKLEELNKTETKIITLEPGQNLEI
ncbi:UNVERIFIED_CONTAM: hypothetical protein GTU68_052820 [Idotea baltica]|nr:hypothetical protein [Idotea baltica]